MAPRSGLGGGVTAACTLLAVGCAAGVREPGIALSRAPAPVAQRLEHVLWLERVSIEAPALPERELLETAFTYNAARYLRARAWFAAVRIPPGQIDSQDWVAQLRVQRVQESEQLTPLGQLLLVPTLGLYSYFARATELTLELDGALELRDGAGRTVASSSAQYRAKQVVSLNERDGQYSFFLDERARALEQLFAAALEQVAPQPQDGGAAAPPGGEKDAAGAQPEPGEEPAPREEPQR